MPFSSSHPIKVIINGGAGCGHDEDEMRHLTQQFFAHGRQIDLTLAKDGVAMAQAARAAINAGVEVIVAGGGDGTVSAVAAVVAGSGVKFGVLPFGTLNHFAKDLQIPQAVADAVATIAAGHSIAVDAAEVNGRLFLNNSSLGLYPDIVRHREKQQRRLGRDKWPAFFWATIAALRRYPFLDLKITVDGAVHRRRTPFIFIGNNAYLMEGLNLGARARLDDGKLSLYVTQKTGRAGLFMLALRALFGRLREAGDLDILEATEVLIETRHRQVRVSTDGEVTLMQAPLAYRILPGALQVIVPQTSQEARHAHTAASV